MDLFSTKGGTALLGAIEAMNQSETGKKLTDKITKEAIKKYRIKHSSLPA